MWICSKCETYNNDSDMICCVCNSEKEKIESVSADVISDVHDKFHTGICLTDNFENTKNNKKKENFIVRIFKMANSINICLERKESTVCCLVSDVAKENPLSRAFRKANSIKICFKKREETDFYDPFDEKSEEKKKFHILKNTKLFNMIFKRKEKINCDSSSEESDEPLSEYFDYKKAFNIKRIEWRLILVLINVLLGLLNYYLIQLDAEIINLVR